MNPLTKLRAVRWTAARRKNAVITADGLDIQRYIFSPLVGLRDEVADGIGEIREAVELVERRRDGVLQVGQCHGQG